MSKNTVIIYSAIPQIISISMNLNGNFVQLFWLERKHQRGATLAVCYAMNGGSFRIWETWVESLCSVSPQNCWLPRPVAQPARPSHNPLRALLSINQEDVSCDSVLKKIYHTFFFSLPLFQFTSTLNLALLHPVQLHQYYKTCYTILEPIIPHDP